MQSLPLDPVEAAIPAPAVEALPPAARGRRLWRLLRRPTALVAVAGCLTLIVLAAAGPRLAPYAPGALDLANQYSPPTSLHLFGTDDLGRDIFSRVIVGTQYSLTAVAVVLGSALVIGLLVGSVAGYAGGLADDVLMRVTDIFLAFPGVVLALAIAAALGPGLTSAMLALAAIWWPTYARLVRGQVLSLKSNAYVEAARSLGASNTRIVVTHIWRNGIAPILVQLTLDMGNVLVSFAGLSFLGLGAAVGTAEWGAMVSAGQSYLMTNWWLSTFPGLAIFVTALLLNMLGDTIQDLMSSGATRI